MDKIKEIASLVRNNEVTLWVGAGFSLYAGLPSGKTLRDMIVDDLFEGSLKDKEELKSKYSLNQISNKYIYMRNDESNRRTLYNYTKSIFTRSYDKNKLLIHLLIREMPTITEIITTNYDNLFELVYENSINVIYNNATYVKAEPSKVNLFK